jgi:hypothetical protein
VASWLASVVRRTLILLIPALLLAACGGPSSDSASPATGAGPTGGTGATAAAAGPAPSVTPGGCGATPVLYGGYPDWIANAGLPAGMRYVVSHEGNLVGVLFADPLVAPPRPDPGPHNKILWISKVPRNGDPLRLTLTPSGDGQPVTAEEPANSSPGEIYPSIVDVPKAGCWMVDAEWGANRATLELTYVPPAEAGDD